MLNDTNLDLNHFLQHHLHIRFLSTLHDLSCVLKSSTERVTYLLQYFHPCRRLRPEHILLAPFQDLSNPPTLELPW